MGFALYQAQIGLKNRDAKSLSGFGSGVFEVVSDFDRNTYRTVYVVRFRQAIYVLHSFQKKSRKGISTPQSDIEVVKRRLKAASQHYDATYGIGLKK
ncbi:MAG: type II toxin-antitoxin system RelE/ParE family toxin [Rhodospirillales bacterium]|nr:type II toxin-antitoxin system RelE/ParE family toxin [Rhodospirillales bacterium]